MDLHALLQEAFLEDEARHATEAIDRAHAMLAQAANLAGFNFELSIPDGADDRWLEEQLVRALVYLCQSRGTPPPACAGVFVSLYVGERLYCILAAEVVAWASEQLHVSEDELADRYGTHETGAAPR
jgi:hypothetical protein